MKLRRRASLVYIEESLDSQGYQKPCLKKKKKKSSLLLATEGKHQNISVWLKDR